MSRDGGCQLQTKMSRWLSIQLSRKRRGTHADHTRNLEIRSKLLQLRPLPTGCFLAEVFGKVHRDGRGIDGRHSEVGPIELGKRLLGRRNTACY